MSNHSTFLNACRIPGQRVQKNRRGFYFKSILSLFFSICLYCITGTAFAQWSSNPAVNTAITTAVNHQEFQTMISDGSGGAIITWSDYRNGSNYDIYAQRINASGVVQWTTDGLAICTATNNQFEPTIVSDGTGGAIITWYDSRSGNFDVYAQRINASGVVQWTTNGVAICTAANSQMGAVITSDGAGGAIIAWSDNRSTGGTDNNIYAQKINSSGVVQWIANGVAICIATDIQSYATIKEDGAGGAIIAWQDRRKGTIDENDIYAQSINASGVVQWTTNGVAICTAAKEQFQPILSGDEAGGSIIAWEDTRNANSDIYAQRINSSGIVQWTVDGVVISAAIHAQNNHGIVSDGSGGAIISWDDNRNGDIDVYAQRINASGIVQWTTDGVAITATEYQQSSKIASDGVGGAIITWFDAGNANNYNIYAQRINPSGIAQWTAGGIAICTATNDQRLPQISSDEAGGAIITWLDHRNGTNIDIYAQQVNADGALGIACQSPTIDGVDITQPSCAMQTGTIIVNPMASTTEYSVDGGANWFTSNTFNDLAPGSYNISVRFQNNPACVASYSGNPVVLNAATGCTACQAPVITNVSTKSGSTANMHSLTSVPAGALLVLTTTNNTNAAPYNCIVTSTPSLSWTKRVDAGATTSNNAEIWTAVFAAGGSLAVTSNWGTATQSSVLYTVTGAEPVLGGAAGIATSQSAPSVAVTTTKANSILFGCTSDWNGINGAARVLRDAATDRFYYRNAAQGYTAYYYTKATTSIGTYTEGVQSPTGQRASTAILEIRCPGTGTPDNTPPTVISVTPLNGSNNVATSTTVTATFSEAMNPATINGTTFELRNPSSALVAATVTYNAGTNTAILTPSSALANSTTYTAKVIGGGSGVKDIAGNAMVGDYSWQFTTASASACQLTILNADNKTNSAATVHSLTGVPAGALLVLNTTNNTNASPYNAIVTSSPALTWTKRADAGAVSSNNAEIWTAIYVAGGSISVTSNWGSVTQASVVYVVTGAESVLGGASGAATLQSAPSVSVTTTRANSILFGCTSDWNGIDGVSKVLRDGATDRFYFRNPSQGYTAYYYTKATTSIGNYTEGISSPAGQKASTAVLEIRCPGAPAVKLANPPVVKTPVYNYSLEQNYPNPASGETSIRFTIPKAEKVSLAVYDINGRVVKVLVHGSRDAGTHTVSFNTGSLAGGVYYYRMKAGDFIKAKKLTVGR